MPRPYSNYRDLGNSKALNPASWKAAWDSGGVQLDSRTSWGDTKTAFHPRDPLKSTFVTRGSYTNALAPQIKSTEVEGGAWETTFVSETKRLPKTGGTKTWSSKVHFQDLACVDVEGGWNAPDVPSQYSSWGSPLNEKIMQWNDSGAMEGYLKYTSHQYRHQSCESEVTNFGDPALQLSTSAVDSQVSDMFTCEVDWSPKGNEKCKAALLPESAEAMSDCKDLTLSLRRRNHGNHLNSNQDPSHLSTESTLKISEPLLSYHACPMVSYPAKVNSTHPNSYSAVPTANSTSPNNFIKSYRDYNPKYYVQMEPRHGANSSHYVFAIPQPPAPHEIHPRLSSGDKDYRPRILDTKPWAANVPHAPSPDCPPKSSTGSLLRKTSSHTYAKVDVNPRVHILQSNDSFSTAQLVDQPMRHKSHQDRTRSHFMLHRKDVFGNGNST